MGNHCSNQSKNDNIFYLYVIIPMFLECKKIQCTGKLEISNQGKILNEVYQTLNLFSDTICEMMKKSEIPNEDGLLHKAIDLGPRETKNDITTTIIACERTPDGCGYYWFCHQRSLFGKQGKRNVLYCTRNNAMGSLNQPTYNDYLVKLNNYVLTSESQIGPTRSNFRNSSSRRTQVSRGGLPSIPMSSRTPASRHSQTPSSSSAENQVPTGKLPPLLAGTQANQQVVQQSSAPKLNDGLPMEVHNPVGLVYDQNKKWFEENKIFDGATLGIDPIDGYNRKYPDETFIRERDWRTMTPEQREKMLRDEYNKPKKITVLVNDDTIRLLANRSYRVYNRKQEDREREPKYWYTEYI